MQSSKTAAAFDNLKWLAPTASECVLYAFIIGNTAVLSYSQPLRNFLAIPPDFSLGKAMLDSIGGLFDRLLGPTIGGWLLTTILWSLVGLLCYLLIWAVINFSLELENDLSIAKFIRPGRKDSYSSLRIFLTHTLVRIGAFCLLFFLGLFTIEVFFPLWIHDYRLAISNWQSPVFIIQALSAALGELIVIHLITILLRVTFWRQRVLG